VSGGGSSQSTTPTSAPLTPSTPVPVTAGSDCSIRSDLNNKVAIDNISLSSHKSSPGVFAPSKGVSSRCSSRSKDQERATLSNGVVRHQSMWWETTHSNNMRSAEWAGRRGYISKSERKSYNTPLSLPSLSLSLTPPPHCSLSQCNLFSFTSHSPFTHSSRSSPTYITYAKGDDTVYSKVGGPLAEGRQSHVWSRIDPFLPPKVAQ
jgi:hypothetical protein